MDYSLSLLIMMETGVDNQKWTGIWLQANYQIHATMHPSATEIGFSQLDWNELGIEGNQGKPNVRSSPKLGSLRNHDGYGDENVTPKYNFELF